MPRRPDERYAVTVHLTVDERDELLSIADELGTQGMADAVRLAVASLASDLGRTWKPGLFVRLPWGWKDTGDDQRLTPAKRSVISR
jgi:hypothetical protein